MQLIQVSDSKSSAQFLLVPIHIYKDDPNFIRPLDKDVNDIFNPKKINISKKLGRNNILSILTSMDFSNNNLGIRINSNKSIEFDKDIELLKLIKDKIKWKYIVIPKIESKSDLENISSIFFMPFTVSIIGISSLNKMLFFFKRRK